MIEEHRLIFRLNNSIIRSFPVSAGQTAKGLIKLLPPEILLILISTIIALILVFYTRRWVVLDPSAEEFADPDFVVS